MPAPVNTEFLNSNSLRAYPIREDASRTASNVSAVLPNYVLVDFIMTIAGPGDVRMYVSQVSVVGTFMTMTFSDGNNVLVTAVTVDMTAHQPNQGYNLIGQGIYEDCRGRVAFGDLSALRTDLVDGAYMFAIDATELEPTTVRPALRGLRSLQIGLNDTTSSRIFGHVKLLAGTNIRLTYLSAYNAIRIDAIDGAGFNEACPCDEATLNTPNCVERITGIALADVIIIGDGKCVDVQTSGKTITIADKCSEPCCGCRELEFLSSRLSSVEQMLSRVETFANTLQEQIMRFISSALLTI